MKTDYEIQKDVMEELDWMPILVANEIGVAVKNGVVTLSGTVDTYGKKIAAEDATKRVFGVKAVAQDIEIKLPLSEKKTDSELAEAALNALKWHTSVPEDKLKIKVEDGWITIEGEVNLEYERDAAKNAVQHLSGVRGVRNYITVKPSPVEKDIKEKITAAFHRSAAIDSTKIKIEIKGNKVILSGRVRSWIEKDEAEKAAWKSKGIMAVENNIEVDSLVYAF